MKTTKHILCIVLALVLVSGLIVPAAAAADPYEPIIVKQPAGPVRAYVGDTFTLEVDAELPAGAPGELFYNWHYYWPSECYEGITISEDGKKLEVTITENMKPRSSVMAGFYVQAWNDYMNNEGETIHALTESNYVHVLIAHPYAPLITKQPPETASIPVGGTLTLEAEAELPQGAPGTLSYAWYDYDWFKEGDIRAPIVTESKLERSITLEEMLTQEGQKSVTYYPVAINTYTDENGATQTLYTQGTGVRVSGSIIDSDLGPFAMAGLGLGCLLLIPVLTPIAVLLLPIVPLTAGYGMIVVAPFLMPIFGVILSFQYFMQRLGINILEQA